MTYPTFIEKIQPIINLFLAMAEHFGLMCAIAVILLSTRTLQRIISRELTIRDKWVLILLFGAFGIFATYDGDPMQGGVANLSAFSMILAGLTGGPAVGIGAGLIAGGHRFFMDMDGFCAVPCGLGTLLQGIAAGLVSMRLKNRAFNWRTAVVLSIVGEAAHLGLILVMAKPFEMAVAVVRQVGIPLVVLNAFGCGFVIEVIRVVVRNRERRASIKARKAMTIANRTVVHLRQGLNEDSALATAKIIHEQTRLGAVAITDTQRILAYVGIGDEIYQPGQRLRTRTTFQVLATGKPVFVGDGTSMGEDVPHHLFQSAIVVPLKKSGEVIGALKFYGLGKHPLNHTDFEIANGLAELFTTQLELEDIQVKAQLLAQAKIKSLKTQINPHFLFNTLNTITFYCRTNTDRARELVENLSTYLRRNLGDGREFITLGEELEQVASYLSIVKARSGDKIDFHLSMDDHLREWLIPPLIVQPLVENAVKHGISGQNAGDVVWIQAQSVHDCLMIRVKDNGVGMAPDIIDDIYRKSGSRGLDSKTGLREVKQRLEQTCGPGASLQIVSNPQEGTAVTLTVPNIKTQRAAPARVTFGYG